MSASKTRVLAMAVGLLLAAGEARAAGTTAGTDVINFATIDYTVGGVNQPDVNSNTVTFETDRLVTLTVAEVGGAYTDVAPGATGQVLTYSVTNNSNAPLDFQLDATQLAGTNDFLGNSDDFDVTAVQVFADANNNNVFDDTATFLDEIPADATRKVFVVASIPLGQANGNSAGVTLTATALEPGSIGSPGALVTQTAGLDTAGAIDTVFSDAAGDTDAARDGKHSDGDAYRIQTAALTVTKISTVISDPVNNTTNPKRIPGAVVEYCISVQNGGSATATAVVVTDVLTTLPVTYQAGSLFTVDTSGACTGGDTEDDDAVDPDENDPNGAAESGGTVSATFTSLPAAASKSMRFRVTIN